MSKKINMLEVKLVDKESNFEIDDPAIWKKICFYLNEKIDVNSVNDDVKLFIFKKIANESKLDSETFYHQHKKEINKNTSKRAAFLNIFGIRNFEEFKRSLKEEYPEIFYDINFRLSIVEKQNYVCAICGADLKDASAHLHHIDYNKQNCNRNNLVFLCPRCHGKTNHERGFWEGVLQEYKENYEVITSDK